MQQKADSIVRQVNKSSKLQLLSIKNLLAGIALILSVVGLYFLSRYNYLLFHSTTEVFTIVIAIVIFTIAWNSRKIMDNNYLAFIGIAFLFVAGLDLLHTLAYKGMGVFPGVSTNLATQLWIAMRYLFAFSLAIPLLFVRKRVKTMVVLATYAIITTFLILSILNWNIFPQAYIDGIGLTPFKIGSEYAISIILAIGIVLMLRNRRQFSDSVFMLLLLAMVTAIATEMAFTLYSDVYGVTNMVGHLLDFFSFFLIYKALVETGFSKPYDLLFRNLKQSENALRESNERFQIMANGTPSLIWVTNKEGKHLFVNKYYLDYFQVTEEQVSGHNWQPLVHPDDRQEYLQQVTNAIKTQQGFKAQARVQKKGEEWRWIETTALPRFNSSNEFLGHVGISIDITERKIAEISLKQRTEELEHTQKKLEENACLLEEYSSQMESLAKHRLEQLKDAERLAAIGATAGMVGHDIRNPLQAMTGDLYLAKAETNILPNSEQKKVILESIEETEKNIDYINKIVQDLQDYARPLNPKAEESDLEEIIRRLVTKNGIPNNISVNIKVADEARIICADSYYLNRILYNLITNAVQAMPQGGKLTISGKKEANDTIILSIKDTGTGIPRDIQSKIFTVMFTTKSKGQGFGLPVVKRMTDSLGGTVTFVSQEGKGTTFTIRLPVKN